MSEIIKDYIIIKKYSDQYYKIVNLKTYNKTITDNGSHKRGQANYKKLDNSISRSKSKVFEYAICNEFDYFVTLTIDPKKYDSNNLEKYYKDLSQFIRNYRRLYNTKIEYVLVPEQHKSGSWHMHGLIKGIVKEHLIINQNGYLTWKKYHDKFGYISLDEIKNRLAVAKYITKYITKNTDNIITELNKKTYYCSRGLKKSETIIEGNANYKVFNNAFSWDYENDYVKVKDMTKDEYENFIYFYENVDKSSKIW